MSRLPFVKPLLLAGWVLSLQTAALASDPLPSLLRVKGGFADKAWTVTIAGGLTKKGKCKIYDRKPQYDGDNRIKTDLVAELKEGGSSYQLKNNKDYWLVFFPKYTLLNVRLTFEKGDNPEKKSTAIQVSGLIAKDIGQTKPDITFANDNPKATCVPNHYQMGLEVEPKPFITLE